MRQATESVKSLALEDVYARVVRLLTDLSDPVEGGQRRVRERLTQQDIADRIGASREMVSRIFKDLSAGGYIDLRTSGHIVIVRKPPDRLVTARACRQSVNLSRSRRAMRR